VKASVLVGVTLLAMVANAGAASPDLLIRGGPIHTGVDSRPLAEAVAVRAGRIVYVGDAEGSQTEIGPATRIIELKGAALFAGFTDSHAHLRTLGERQLALNLEDASSIADVQSRLAAYLKANPGHGAVWGAGWIETRWPEHRFLHRADLDAIAPDRPVLLRRIDGHALVANSSALKAAGIDQHTSVPEGGQVGRDDRGELTGILVDSAFRLVDRLRAAPSEDERLADFRAAFATETALGWTSMHSMSVAWADVLLLERLARQGEVRMRIYNCVDEPESEPLFTGGPRSVADGLVVTRAIAEFGIDGALGSRGAALFAPYSDQPGWQGAFTNEPRAMRTVLQRALARGIQVAIHAIGDRGNAIVLDLFQDELATVPKGSPSPRWRIEHAQILRPSDIPRFGQLRVIASVQPSHFIVDFPFAPARLGLERLEAKGAYAWKSLLDSGAVVVGGSDAPWESGNPLIQFYAAVTRRDLQGQSFPHSHPEEALTRTEALKLFTSSAAYARFAEHELGTIEVGKRADLTAFSIDLLTAPVQDIPRGRAVLTIVDGRISYSTL
jgi:predicted amidohydrolase YtcJ